MSLKENISDELKRTPVAAISGAAAVVIAALSLALAWIQHSGTSSSAAQVAETLRSTAEFSLGNVFLILAYFLAITVSVSLLIRSIARTHDITALFASVPLIALTNFSVILLIYIAPPRVLSQRLFASAHDLVFYASAAIVIAFCGHAVLKDLASTNSSKEDKSDPKTSSSSSDAIGFLFAAFLLLAVWSWLVFAGQTRLTRTLLPDITHLPDKTSSAVKPRSIVEQDSPEAGRP
jgi:hypothetical protein